MQARDKHVLTIEGLAPADKLHPIQECFLKEDSGQCGYCTPGFVMSTYALLRQNLARQPKTMSAPPSSGNLCRCNAYGRIIQGVMAAAKTMRESSQ